MTTMPTYPDGFSSFNEVKTGTIGFDRSGDVWASMNGTWTKVGTGLSPEPSAAPAPSRRRRDDD